ncbi:MAG: hypothetical protein KKE11_05550 [Gammaproteobacteria bacterium]|nr:hypothetical protein [Gammaproteobacteria bacterium]
MHIIPAEDFGGAYEYWVLYIGPHAVSMPAAKRMNNGLKIFISIGMFFSMFSKLYYIIKYKMLLY